MATSAQHPPAPEAEPAPRLSIVVLPLANLSNDPDQEYFADGIVIARMMVRALKLRKTLASPSHNEDHF